MTATKRHHIRVWASELRIKGDDGHSERLTVHYFSCNPCGIFSKGYTSRSARDRAVTEHGKG